MGSYEVSVPPHLFLKAIVNPHWAGKRNGRNGEEAARSRLVCETPRRGLNAEDRPCKIKKSEKEI